MKNLTIMAILALIAYWFLKLREPKKPPLKPIVLSTTDINSNSFTLNWKATEGATSYSVSGFKNQGIVYLSPFGPAPLNVGNVTSLNISDVYRDGNPFIFQISANNEYGASVWSDSITVSLP